jgi:hypothetical protein
MLTFDGCDVTAITFLFYETNWSAIKMSCWLIVACHWLLSRIQRQRPFLIETAAQLIIN